MRAGEAQRMGFGGQKSFNPSFVAKAGYKSNNL
jgi:hypothetical protein